MATVGILNILRDAKLKGFLKCIPSDNSQFTPLKNVVIFHWYIILVFNKFVYHTVWY